MCPFPNVSYSLRDIFVYLKAKKNTYLSLNRIGIKRLESLVEITSGIVQNFVSRKLTMNEITIAKTQFIYEKIHLLLKVLHKCEYD